MLYCQHVAVAFGITVNPVMHTSRFLVIYLFVYVFIFPPLVQMEKMELMKKERLENHPLRCCRPLPVKWSILMTGKKLMLLGNVRNTISFVLVR